MFDVDYVHSHSSAIQEYCEWLPLDGHGGQSIVHQNGLILGVNLDSNLCPNTLTSSFWASLRVSSIIKETAAEMRRKHMLASIVLLNFCYVRRGFEVQSLLKRATGLQYIDDNKQEGNS